MEEIKLSVIIVSYKKLDVLINCLYSIYNYNDLGKQLEVIVVDNSPDYNIINNLEENFKQVKVIKNKNNGFGEGNNIGAKNSSGKYIVFLNPDTILIEPIFKFAIEKFENNKNLGLFGLKLVDIDLNRNMSFYIMDSTSIISAQIMKICNKFDFFIDGKMFIAGADMFVRREAFFKSGMFDEKIFMFNEEADIIKRIKYSQYKTAYFKTKKIIHLEGTSEDNMDAIKIGLVSNNYYYNKYGMKYSKKLKFDIRYQFLKLIIYRLLNNKNMVEVAKEKIIIFKDYLNTKLVVISEQYFIVKYKYLLSKLYLIVVSFVITFNTGGSVECIDEKCGIIVEKGNIKELVEAINNVKINRFDKEIYIQKAKKFDKIERFNEYIEVYRQE